MRVVLCMIIAVTAATAWDELDAVPSPAAVEAGARITWGADGVWGIFPTTAEEETYAGFYDPDNDQWALLGESPATEVLEQTSITFQWLEDGVLFVIGVEDDIPTLYWYSLYSDEWNYDDLPFNLGSGACIAYQPNLNYNIQMNPVPGWIYCLSGGSSDFYRYAIPTSLPDVALDGIHPGQGSVIADATPHFLWQNNGASQYRLQVSDNPNFSATGLDTVVSATQYDVAGPMDNDTYYWRIGTENFGTWVWSSTHSFEIDAGWEPLTDIPNVVGEGAAMAYDGEYFGHKSIVALIGDGERESYEYDIVQNSWNALHDAPVDVIVGTSLTTHDATEQPGIYPWAAFGGSGTSDNPWYYDRYLPIPNWVEWDDHTQGSHFPQWLGPGASMAYGANDYLYLIVGENSSGTPRNNFYRVGPSSLLMDGSQTGSAPAGIARTLVVTRYDDVGVEYQLRTTAHVRATLHDAVGRKVGAVDAGEQRPGMHRLGWDRDNEGRKLSAGAYFVLLDIGTEQVTLKAVVR